MDTNNFNIEFQPLPTNPQFHNLAGQIFNRWTVLGYAGQRRKRMTYWFCKCKCGGISAISSGTLKNGTSQSCGCLWKENITKHGQTGSTEYKSYNHAKERCNNPKHHAYKDYGGRGIEFKFKSFEDFFACLGNKPSPQHSLDRFPDNGGHYEPTNVRWATKKQQQQNRRNNVMLTFQGKTQCAAAWADEYGFHYREAIVERKTAGWCDECAITLPLNKIHRSRCSHISKTL